MKSSTDGSARGRNRHRAPSPCCTSVAEVPARLAVMLEPLSSHRSRWEYLVAGEKVSQETERSMQLQHAWEQCVKYKQKQKKTVDVYAPEQKTFDTVKNDSSKHRANDINVIGIHLQTCIIMSLLSQKLFRQKTFFTKTAIFGVFALWRPNRWS